jgi:hypothetical protein
MLGWTKSSLPKCAGRDSNPRTATPSPRCQFFMPLACPSTLDRPPGTRCRRADDRPTWRGFGARVSQFLEEWHAKAHVVFSRVIHPRTESLSLSGGASMSNYVLFKLSITSRAFTSTVLPKRRRRPFGRPRSSPLCAYWPSASTSLRGLRRNRLHPRPRQSGSRRSST